MITTTNVDKKERVIVAAIKLWRQAQNMNNVSLADIAQEVGVSPTQIYDIFVTREGLVEEVIKQLTQEILTKQQAILEEDLPFPEKIQAMLSVKMKTINGLQVDLLDKICTDPAAKKYVNEISETQAKPMMTAIIEEGKREGYIYPDLPDEVIMLYFNILRAGDTVCSEEIKRIISDKRLTTALIRLIYFGLFRKEFDITLNNHSNS